MERRGPGKDFVRIISLNDDNSYGFYSSGVHIMKTNQAILISVYEEPVVPEECATVTEKLGEYLISVNY